MSSKEIYLDHAATTYVYPEVSFRIDQMLKELWGNPISLHTFGIKAQEEMQNARIAIAKAINADVDEIVFTSCSSEANAFAINQVEGCFCSPYEHHDILANPKVRICAEDFFDKFEKMSWFEQQYYRKEYYGYLYAHMLVNNETGEIFDINDKLVKAKALGMYTLVDATQALGNIAVDVKSMEVDFMSFSFHKTHAPKGIGACYIRKEVQDKLKIRPLIYGSQENNMRGGTSNTPYIVAAGYAVPRAIKEMEMKNKHCSKLREILIDELTKAEIPFIINEGKHNVSSILNIAFKGITGDAIQLMLDEKGIYVSTGSACDSGNLDPSATLKAMNVPDDYIKGAIRISMSLNNTKKEMYEVAKNIIEIYNKEAVH